MRQLLVLAFIAIVTTMTFAQSSKQVFPGANPSLPFSAAVKADGLIYVSGTLGSGGGVKAQTKQVLDNINTTLKAARSSLANAASLPVYLRDLSHFPPMKQGSPYTTPKQPPA